MCIISAKPAGVKMPDTETIRRMWYANRDGAGFMYAADGKVVIHKGYMKLADFEAALAELSKLHDLDALPLVMHFRITTHGGTKPANCHPFPVTRSIKSLQALKAYSALGVAHNGIIPIRPRNGISDTMEYIATQLAPLASALPGFTRNAHALELIENAIQSKMCFLTDSGEITTIGDFTRDGGVLYSNLSYKGYDRKFTYWWDDIPATPKAPAGGKKTSSKSTATKAKPKAPTRTKKPLQWAFSLPNGTYAVDFEGGTLIEDLTDLLIDENGKAYVFDYDADAARKAPDIRLYNAEGMASTFEPDMADLEYIIDTPPFRL